MQLSKLQGAGWVKVKGKKKKQKKTQKYNCLLFHFGPKSIVSYIYQTEISKLYYKNKYKKLMY